MIPTKHRILERARELFHRRESASREETVTNPEESELKESGDYEQAKRDLMRGEQTEAVGQQKKYVKEAGAEVGMTVLEEDEYKGIQLERRQNRWRSRGYKEAAKKGSLIFSKPKSFLGDRAGSFFSDLAKPYPSGHQSWPSEKGIENFRGGLKNMFHGKPELKKEREETKRFKENAFQTGMRRGIYVESYRQGYRKGVRKQQGGSFFENLLIGQPSKRKVESHRRKDEPRRRRKSIYF